jgi:lipoprotein-releasing system ATP-binding protein
VQVTCAGVGHRFADGPWLFRGLDAVFRPGRVYAVTGPSGSGKSTLLGLLAGWDVPAEGSVTRTGAGAVSWVFQNPVGVAGRSAADHVALPLLAAGATPGSADREARELLGILGLRAVADRPFRALSGGEAQRLMLARGIAGRPTLLLLDEPTAQLDIATAADVNRGIAALAGGAADGPIVVVATHDAATQAACDEHLDLRDHQSVDATRPADATRPEGRG